MSNPHTKDAAILKIREGRYCERTLRPGGVSFTYNNPAARISLRSKLDTNKKRRVETRRFLLSNPHTKDAKDSYIFISEKLALKQNSLKAFHEKHTTVLTTRDQISSADRIIIVSAMILIRGISLASSLSSVKG